MLNSKKISTINLYFDVITKTLTTISIELEAKVIHVYNFPFLWWEYKCEIGAQKKTGPPCFHFLT